MLKWKCPKKLSMAFSSTYHLKVINLSKSYAETFPVLDKDLYFQDSLFLVAFSCLAPVGRESPC